MLGAGDRGGISFSQKMNLGILAGRSSAAGAEDLFPHGLRNFTGEEDSDIIAYFNTMECGLVEIPHAQQVSMPGYRMMMMIYYTGKQ